MTRLAAATNVPLRRLRSSRRLCLVALFCVASWAFGGDDAFALASKASSGGGRKECQCDNGKRPCQCGPEATATAAAVTIDDLETPELPDISSVPPPVSAPAQRTCQCDNGRRPCQCPSKSSKSEALDVSDLVVTFED